MAIGDVYQLTASQVVHGQSVLNIFHYLQTAGSTGNQSEDLALQFDTDVVPFWDSAMSTEWLYGGCIVSRVAPEPRSYPFTRTLGQTGGQIAGEPVPICAPVTVTLTTLFAGVRFRGRKYLSGLSSADVNNSIITPAAQGRLQILADNFTIPLGSDPTEFLPILYHRDNNTFTFIDKAIARLVIRNMRSRQVGVGV